MQIYIQIISEEYNTQNQIEDKEEQFDKFHY